MALRAIVNNFVPCNNSPVERREEETAKTKTKNAILEIGRRGILLSTALTASQVSDTRTELLQKYLKKSEENKAKNDKERLDSYYKRNYQDYFDFVEGSVQGKDEKELSESEKGILDWLKKNK